MESKPKEFIERKYHEGIEGELDEEGFFTTPNGSFGIQTTYTLIEKVMINMEDIMMKIMNIFLVRIGMKKINVILMKIMKMIMMMRMMIILMVIMVEKIIIIIMLKWMILLMNKNILSLLKILKLLKIIIMMLMLKMMKVNLILI